MDGVLGKVDTSCTPAAPEATGTTGDAMVKDLRPKQTIRFEFGARDNWVTLYIERIETLDKMITLFGKNDGYQGNYSFRPEDVVEVLDA